MSVEMEKVLAVFEAKIRQTESECEKLKVLAGARLRRIEKLESLNVSLTEQLRESIANEDTTRSQLSQSERVICNFACEIKELKIENFRIIEFKEKLNNEEKKSKMFEHLFLTQTPRACTIYTPPLHAPSVYNTVAATQTEPPLTFSKYSMTQ